MDTIMDMPSSPSMNMTASMGTMPSIDTMSGMSSTFSSSIRVTLWFTTWTTTTPATYFLTIIFLFCLGIFNRFLGALRSQLEQNWQIPEKTDRGYIHEVKTRDIGSRGHTRQRSRGSRTLPMRLEEQDGKETEPLSPASSQPRDIEEETGGKSIIRPRKFWVANAPWSIKKDGISAMLEFVRALIAYILMLAVMTYNIGFLFAVTGSVLIGELVFGRYTRASPSLAEEGCHS